MRALNERSSITLKLRRKILILERTCNYPAKKHACMHGKNPGGKLQFSSSGCYCINTGPRVRAYADSGYEDFLYAIDETVQLCVHAEGTEE